MPTTKNKKQTGNSKNNPENKNSKKPGITSAQMPRIPTATERAKTKDFNRRGDAESNEL